MLVNVESPYKSTKIFTIIIIKQNTSNRCAKELIPDSIVVKQSLFIRKYTCLLSTKFNIVINVLLHLINKYKVMKCQKRHLCMKSKAGENQIKQQLPVKDGKFNHWPWLSKSNSVNISQICKKTRSLFSDISEYETSRFGEEPE